ncbi:class I SAM-dependent methyltransferase [Rhodococcus aetherivorans]|uniref:class I SAM-dependent methyltransferase n=1 Tax=Rhodococcus TaxID=1827 RepID=UPI0002D23591|nr:MULTISPECIES: class I SAM-dependent methyltransferase [Rhodococcus]AKE90951.1 methyltransferase [Rhodococcus aetherivorans]ANZ24276.1 methyltransferase [Rhodococcus sp. WB1]KDE12364.1 methyltransferase [Rhodococcus aetherivorans]MDV6293830.1 class I SAM-dependent methyltransferase [Rhodococcus aetherivorans]CCW09845.1 Methyltransferase type 11 [Rhodococcus aetherivorans]
MTDHTADAWEIAAAYERYVGRWSRPVASKFLQWLPPAGAGAAWCDVGCGTGALAHAVLVAEEPSRVVGVEPSEGFAAAARTTVDDPRFEVRPGTAAAIPAVDGEFDRVVSGLVLNFLPDPIEGLVEMRRVTRAGGTIGGYVWDYAEGMEMIRAFWDAAVELDEAARDRDEGVRFPLCRPDPLHDLLASAGLTGVRIQPLEVPTVFADFDDFWAPFLGGQGPAPGYCMSLPARRRAELRTVLDARLRRDRAGRIALTARAWAFHGSVPD